MNTKVVVKNANNLRLRLQFFETTGGSLDYVVPYLEFSTDKSKWSEITNTSKVFNISPSSYVTDWDYITSPVFDTDDYYFYEGYVSSDYSSTPELFLIEEVSEYEYVLQPNEYMVENVLYYIRAMNLQKYHRLVEIQNSCNPQLVYSTSTIKSCGGDVKIFNKTTSELSKVRWYEDESLTKFITESDTLLIKDIDENKTYYCVAYNKSCDKYSKAQAVNIEYLSLAHTLSSDSMCSSESKLFTISTEDSKAEVTWYDNAEGKGEGRVGNTLFINAIVYGSDTTLYYKITNEHCATSILSYKINVQKSTLFDIYPNDAKICPGSPVNLYVVAEDDYSDVLWSQGGTTDTITVAAAGVYSAIMTNSYGCKSFDTVTVDNFDLPTTDGFNHIADMVNNHRKIRFEPINPVGVKNYHWEFGDGNVSIEKNPTHIYDKDGEYIVVLKVDNDYCPSSTKSLKISISADPLNISNKGELDKVKLFPNPNNGNFTISCESKVIKKVEIYNTLGQLIYYIGDIKNNIVDLSINNIINGSYFINIYGEDNDMSIFNLQIK